MAQKDDLEAVRAVVAALDGFDAEEQERIIRWAREKVKLPVSALPTSAATPVTQQQPATLPPAAPVTVSPASTRDLRMFVAEKRPKSDVQFAATVAYFYRFEAPQAERKAEIVADDLGEACRLANRERLRKPLQTLQNARMLGLLDSPRRGAFTINAVGENLVAMTLPGDGNAQSTRSRKAERKAKATKKTTGTK